MPWSALPDHLNTPEKWAGTDHDTKWTRWLLHLKGWMAYGPRAKQQWARWREFPKTLFALRSKQGVFRVETEGWERDSSWDCDWNVRVFSFLDEIYAWRDLSDSISEMTPGYLSRVQKYARWSFQIQWPFLVAFHWYNRATNVPKYGNPTPSGFADGKLWFFYFGAHRDADKVYMFPSAYFGRNWK